MVPSRSNYLKKQSLKLVFLDFIHSNLHCLRDILKSPLSNYPWQHLLLTISITAGDNKNYSYLTMKVIV